MGTDFDAAKLLDIGGPDFVTEEDLTGGAAVEGKLDGAEGRLVGVADLDNGLLGVVI